MKKLLILVIFSISFFLKAQTTTITYQESTLDFRNPERGFYTHSEAIASNYSPLVAADINSWKNDFTPFNAAYSIRSSLVFRNFVLDLFVNDDISQAYLDNMQTDFNTIRDNGVKLIIRFSYNITPNPNGCANFACPPYGDASPERIESHLKQLEPLLKANTDVIACVQMGLIGIWGEHYYTDYYGDASQSPSVLTDKNWIDRIDLLNQVLKVIPADRMVQVRYPQMKQRYLRGVNASTSTKTSEELYAFNESNRHRIGFYNDCFISGPDDYGTYADYGNDRSGSTSDTLNIKPYLRKDSKYVVVGGETCNDAYSPQNDCEGTDALAVAEKELRQLHFSYLNSGYNNDVNNDWETGGCMNDIKTKLGYRILLVDGTFTDEAQQGQRIDVTLNLKNIGYASMYNPRNVQLIFKSAFDTFYVDLDIDPRKWYPSLTDIYTIDETICIPDTMPQDTYEVFLNLNAPEQSLEANPDYSVRAGSLLPNSNDVWDAATGYNNLGHSLIINSTATSDLCDRDASKWLRLKQL